MIAKVILLLALAALAAGAPHWGVGWGWVGPHPHAIHDRHHVVTVHEAPVEVDVSHGAVPHHSYVDWGWHGGSVGAAWVHL